MSDKIYENVFEAVNTLIDAKLQNINFNSTILCTIIDDSKAASGIFTVDNAGIKFQATSLDKNLQVNDQVYVTIPNNDFGAQKIILCKKDDFEEIVDGWRNPLEYLDVKYKFEDITPINWPVVLTPTYSGQNRQQSQVFNRIILEKELTYQNSSFSYQNFGEAASVLDASGWEFFTGSSITTKNAPLTAVLKRYLPGTQSNDYVIRSLDLEESENALVPVGGGIPEFISGTGYIYYNKQWQDAATRRDFLESFSIFEDTQKYLPISLAGLKNIIISIDCKTINNLIDDKIIAGDYGIYCRLRLQDCNNNNASININLDLSSNYDFLGDPYNFFDYYTQTAIFDVQNYQNYIVNRIEFYMYQNDNFILESGNNITNTDFRIYFKNANIYFGTPKQETEKGYKNYESYFQTQGKYYQKLDNIGVEAIYKMLDHIPAIDTELDSDGPFSIPIGALGIQLTNDTIPKDDKIYYSNINFASQIPLPIPKSKNPAELKWYEDVEQTNGKRYFPKLYIKNSSTNKYIESSGPKYYDELAYFPIANVRITTHDWHTNKYSWDNKKQLWVLIDSNNNPDNYPQEQEYYVCYLPGRKIEGYFGGIESIDESEPPKLGISSQQKNIDVVLQTLSDNSNINIYTKQNTGQININASDNSQIIINNDGISCLYKKDDNNSIAFRLGYYNNNTNVSTDDFPAINLAIKQAGIWQDLHLSGDDLTKLKKLIANYINIRDNHTWSDS